MMTLLRNKVVVTGSSSGIGRACAIECAKQEAKVLLCHQGTKQTEDDAENVQKELSLRIPHLLCYTGRIPEIMGLPSN
jgi:L-rhamnose 1-dehydrogenase